MLLKANGHEGQSRNYVCFFNSDIQMNFGPANYLSKENTEKESFESKNTATASTYGQILPEYLCRRMRAMVVRTAMVVHMVAGPPRPPTPPSRDPGCPLGSARLCSDQ